MSMRKTALNIGITGQYACGLGDNDVLTGTAKDELLHGGFGDDLICHGNGGTDLVYGGPGKDVLKLHSGGTLNIRGFRKGTDFMQLSVGRTDADVELVFDGFNNYTSFKKGSETLASVYGTNPNDERLLICPAIRRSRQHLHLASNCRPISKDHYGQDQVHAKTMIPLYKYKDQTRLNAIELSVPPWIVIRSVPEGAAARA